MRVTSLLVAAVTFLGIASAKQCCCVEPIYNACVLAEVTDDTCATSACQACNC
ncbi:hypothetical protein CGMCC3_g14778 [Colletotrichum fructicola]|nr:uncharacterized protein CGMCC3_g14778 [Colletotrichum fructicola]KAE9569184.1 hypothetical protein CGMCC3_g14778 [Colletotrichum fructicola]